MYIIISPYGKLYVQTLLQIVEFLLDMSEVRVNLNDSHTGDTALAAACRHGHNETVAILIKRGANVAATNLQVTN